MAKNKPIDCSQEQLERLIIAARCCLADLLHEINKGGVPDEGKKSAVELYDALADIGQELEAYTFDVEMCREDLLPEDDA